MRTHRIPPFISIERANSYYAPEELDEQGNVLTAGPDKGLPPWFTWIIAFDSPDEALENGDLVYHIEPDERAFRGLEKAQSVVIRVDDLPSRSAGRFQFSVIEIREGNLFKEEVSRPEEAELPDLPPEPPAWEEGLPEGYLCGIITDQQGNPALLRECETEPKRLRAQVGCSGSLSELLARVGEKIVLEGVLVGKTIYVKSWA